MSLNTLCAGYSSLSTSVNVVYISRWPQPSQSAGGRISTTDGMPNSDLFSLLTARATESGFSSPSCDKVPSNALYLYTNTQITFQLFFYKRLTVFQNKNLIARFYQLMELFFRQWILSDFEYRIFTAFGVVFHQVIVTDTTCDDS